MAKQVNPKFYPPRSCFRSRKTINGVTHTFYGGHGASSANDQEAYARAVLEISEQIAQAMNPTLRYQAELDEIVQEQAQEIQVGRELDALDEAAEEVMQGRPNPLIEELQQVKAEAALLRTQIQLMGATAQNSDEPLKVLQEKYTAIQTQQGEAEGKSRSTINEYAKSSREFVAYLEEHGVTTTAQLDQASAIVAEFRDDWLEKIGEGKSKSMARRMLLGSKQFTEWMLSREYISRMPPAITRKWAAVGKDLAKPTYLTPLECQQLFKAATPRLKLPILLGLNAGYRSSDLLSLKRTDIDLDKGIILRQRHKTGKAQAHKLWGITKQLLEEHLATLPKDADPFATNYSNISKEITEYMQETVSQDPDKRTAKSLRSTGANELEKLLKGKEPKIISQYLAHGDSSQAKHYRTESTQALFQSLDKLEVVFSLKE